jgi:stearoyl-CoA desaturase (delta-9 desaturase)
MVGHFAHRTLETNQEFEALPVQGRNLPGLGLFTFGENWHGNHHAFPESAKLGIGHGQFDPGYLLITCLQKCGLAWNVNTPKSELFGQQ